MSEYRNLEKNLKLSSGLNHKSELNGVMKTETIKKNGAKLNRKNLIYCIAASMLLFSQTINAQITLEHTFVNEQVHFANSPIYFIGPFGDGSEMQSNGDAEFIIYRNTEQNQIKLYNTDYSLYKNINIISPPGYNIWHFDCFTKELFDNNDDKIEFLVISHNNETETFSMILYNEDGTILKDFEKAWAALVYKIEEQYKLFVYRTDEDWNITTEIYSLPGKTTSIAPITGNNISKSPYPNPTNTSITLPYKLKQGETSIMHIYSMNGQLIETKQIDSGYDKILLNVSGYAKGVYIYEVNGVSNRFVVR